LHKAFREAVYRTQGRADIAQIAAWGAAMWKAPSAP
jgi:hypothetical protein